MQIPALDENVEPFVVQITFLSLILMPIHPDRKAQIASLVIGEGQIPALNKNVETFIVYVTFFSLNLMPIYLAQEAQIALLVIEKVHPSGPHQYLLSNEDQGK